MPADSAAGGGGVERGTVVHTNRERVFKDHEIHKAIARAESGKLYRDFDDSGAKFSKTGSRRDSMNALAEEGDQTQHHEAMGHHDFAPCANTWQALGEQFSSAGPAPAMATGQDTGGINYAQAPKVHGKDLILAQGNMWNGSGCGPAQNANYPAKIQHSDESGKPMQRKMSLTAAGIDMLGQAPEPH